MLCRVMCCDVMLCGVMWGDVLGAGVVMWGRDMTHRTCHSGLTPPAPVDPFP